MADVELNDAWYVLRELQPSEDKVDVKQLNGKLTSLEKLVKTIAKVVAWGQLRSAGRQGVANARDLAEFAHTKHWEDELLAYARSYAQQVQHDFDEFRSAYDHGAFETARHFEKI